jgi:Flp pilus assembly pilin Flp
MLHRWTAYLRSRLATLSADEEGQTMVEYVMLIVLVALAVFLATPNIKSAILKVFENTSSALS